MKPALSPTTTGSLPSRWARRLDVVDDRVLGHDGADDLDELQHRCGVEEVQAHDPARVVRRDRDLGHRQAGGVGGEDRVGADDGVELAEDLALEVQVLGHGLDHQVTVGQVLQCRREVDVRVQGGLVLRGELAPADRAVGRVLQHAAAVLERPFAGLDRGDVEPVAREHLDDARAHRAEPDHADLAELTPHRVPLPHASPTRCRGSACHDRRVLLGLVLSLGAALLFGVATVWQAIGVRRRAEVADRAGVRRPRTPRRGCSAWSPTAGTSRDRPWTSSAPSRRRWPCSTCRSSWSSRASPPRSR